MRQNDLHKRLFLFWTAHQKWQCVYGEGSGQITPPFPVSSCLPEGDPFYEATLFSVLMLEPYSPATWALYIHRYIFWSNPLVVYVLQGMWWVFWLRHTSAVFWSGGSWAQPLSSVHSWTEVDFRLQKVHLVRGRHAMFFYRGKLLPDASSIQTTTTKRVALCVRIRMGHMCKDRGRNKSQGSFKDLWGHKADKRPGINTSIHVMINLWYSRTQQT